MSGGSLTTELRDSVRLLGSERRLFAGGFVGAVVFALWVFATGTLVQSVAPSLTGTTLLTAGGASVDAFTAFAAVAWVVVPGVVSARLLDRYLRNHRGNLESRYRFDHPSLLLAPSGVVVLLAVGLSSLVGQSLPLLVAATVASAHLLVRTLAYGHRVYSFSVPALFSLFAFLTGGALAVGWLLFGAAFADSSARLSQVLSAAGVTSVVETAVALAGTDAGTLLAGAAVFPAVLSLAYLVAQSAVAAPVALGAPVENPQPRPGQRYPPNAVERSSRETTEAAQVATDGSAEAGGSSETASEAEATDGTDSSETDAADRPGTRVFTPDEPVPEVDERDDTDETTADEWFEDTAVYTDDAASGDTPDECPACRADIPLETNASFCPNCGERLD